MINIQKKYGAYEPIITCEGACEKAYIEWLAFQINSLPNSRSVKIRPIICKNPFSQAKRVTAPYEKDWFHFTDTESTSEDHTKTFQNSLLSLKKAKSIKNNLKINLAYTNVSFELWLLLHKQDYAKFVHKAKDYYSDLKKVYDIPKKIDFDDYKKENFFKKNIISQLTLEDVFSAIKRARKLMEDINDRTEMLYGFKIIRENPSLSIHNCIENILNNAHIIII